MAVILSGKELAEAALRKVGAFPITQTGADIIHLRETLTWLDLIMAELSGTAFRQWLMKSTLSVPLTGGTATYDLDDTLGSSAPTDGIQFPMYAMFDDGSGNQSPVKIVTRIDFEKIQVKATSGTPELIYIDRLNDPSMTTYPVLGSGLTGRTIKLVVQSLSPDFHGERTGVKATNLKASWQKYMIYATAAAIGDGSVIKIPDAELRTFREVAKDSRAILEAFEDREHENTEPVTAFRDF